MNEPDLTVQDLVARFPYMFQGPHIGLNHFTGWFATFVQLCVAVDAVLGSDKRGFHWVQIKAKFGAARFYFAVDRRSPTRGENQSESGEGVVVDVPIAFVRALVDQAESITSHLCIRCGQPATTINLDGYVWTLCTDHRPPSGASRAQLKAWLKALKEGLHAV